MQFFFRIFSYFLIVVLISSCTDSAPEADASEGGNTAAVEYYLFNSFPVKQSFIPEDGGELLPWTEQVRIADYTAADNFLYLAVNNTGILKIPLDNPSEENIELVEDELYISGNTMKSLFYYKDSLFCHLYRDTFFTDDFSGSSESPLIKLDSTVNVFMPEFIRSKTVENMEAVDFIYAGGEWVSSWKYSDKDTSSFSYYMHDIKGKGISEISEAEYRASLASYDDADSADPSLLKILNFVHEKSEPGYMTDLSLKYLDCTAVENHRFIKTSEEPGTYLNIPVYRSGTGYWFSEGSSIYNFTGSGIAQLDLDPLPEGYRYTGICSEKGKVYLFWEYQSFFSTGNTGFSIIDEKRVDKITI